MEIGIWTSFYVDMEIEDAVRHLAEIGWFHIEYSFDHISRATEKCWKTRLKSLREICLSLNVKAWQLHSPLSLNLANFNRKERERDLKTASRWLEYCQILDVPYMVIHPGGSQGYRSLKERNKIIELNIESFKRLGRVAEDLGVKLVIENMLADSKCGGRRFLGEHIYEILEIIEAVGSPSIGICFDTSHANALNLDIPEAIRECGGLLWATHISDNDGSGDQHRLPYNGNIDWIAVIKALKSIGYQNLLDLEIPGETVKPIIVRDMKLKYAKEVLSWLLNQYS